MSETPQPATENGLTMAEREDDNAGYDQAISLLCDAEVMIRELLSAPVAPLPDSERETLKAESVMAMARHYRSGESMPQYATLGIGVDAWVDLTEQEKPRSDGRRLSDSVIVKRSTFNVVMRVLRAVRISDFKPAASPETKE